MIEAEHKTVRNASGPRRPFGAGWWLAHWSQAARVPACAVDAFAGERGGAAGAADAESLALFFEADAEAPAHAARGHLRAVFDGMLFDRAEWLKRLEGAIGPEASDAEIVLAIYERQGERGLARLRGFFAIVVADAERQRLLAMRDPMGVFPLFYARRGDGLAAATSIAALLRLPGFSPSLNRAAIADYLRTWWTSAEETMYEGVLRVMPGHILRLDRAGLHTERYWDPAPPGSAVEWLSDDDMERFNGLLDQAVSRCLALGRAGVFLSGGFDSISVAGVAADVCQRRGDAPPWALSLAFPDPTCDEVTVQRRVAAGLGMPQQMIGFDDAVGELGLMQASIELSARMGQPVQNFWKPAYQRLGLAGRQQGCDVLLTGGGGDEWLTVGPTLAADLIGSGQFLELGRLVANHMRSYQVARLHILRATLWKFGMRPLLHEQASRVYRRVAPGVRRRQHRENLRRAIPGWLAPDPALKAAMVERGGAYLERTESREDVLRSHYLRAMRTAMEHPLMAMDMEELFENGRELGAPVLQLFTDSDLVEFLYRTPPRLLNRGGRNKGLVRQTLAQRFPHLEFERQKKVVATTYFRSITSKEAGPAWQRMGGAAALAELGIVDPAALNAAIGPALQGRESSESLFIWFVLNSEAWVRPRA